MDDLPVLKKCCFCVPLRYGLLLWGYMKLFSDIIMLIISAIILVIVKDYIIEELGIFIIVFGILIAEILIHIVFIVGTHKKKVKLLNVYYYYAIFVWAVTITGVVVSTALIIVTMSGTGDTELRISLLLGNFFAFAFSIAMQTFLLFALRSEIIKLRSNCPYRYVKGTEDSEGAVKVEEEPPEDKATQLITDQGTSR